MSHVPGSHAPSICLVSPIRALDNGGTAAYIRHLGNHLSRQHSVRGVSRRVRSLPQILAYEDSDTQEVVAIDGGWETQIIAPHSVSRPALRGVLSMTTRPVLQNAGVSIFQAAYGKAVNAAIPTDTNVVHYVGTGWELMGFSALASARRRGAAFVITPFVHPGAWGDSALDVRPEQFRKIGLAPASNFVGDGKRFRETEGLGNCPLVLFIGRKQAYKGYHALRQAVQIVRETIPDVCLAAAGVEAFGIVYVEAWAYKKPVLEGTAPAVRVGGTRHNRPVCRTKRRGYR